MISVFDSGLLHGDGVFTVLRGRAAAPVDLEGHLEQLTADAAQLELRCPSSHQLRVTVAAVLAAFGPRDARLRILITRGRGGVHLRWRDRGPGHVLVIAEAATPPRPTVRVAIVDEPRLSPSASWAAKSLSYQPALWAREQAARRGAAEALRLFPDETVAEGASSNLFGVWAGEVVTPPALGIRPGVTRRRVIELARRRGLRIAERPIPRAALSLASELFVTSSIAGVVPVEAIDAAPVPLGPIAAALRAHYERWAARRGSATG